MALIECGNCEKDVYAKPSQQTITFNQYPLVRGLYYVLKENYAGMGSRFVNFLSTERGQLIFKRALLVPEKTILVQPNAAFRKFLKFHEEKSRFSLR
jgi:phosphate transport system substrate-binding protein